MRRSLVAGATLLAVVACSGMPPRSEVLGDLTEQVYKPAIAALADGADSLVTAVEAACATPGPETLESARRAWETVATAWGGAEVAAFGPIMDLRLGSSIRYAVDIVKVQELAQASPTPEALAAAGADVRGIDAVGVLLFGAGSEDLTGASGSGRCAYAAAVTHQVAEAAATVASAWESDFAAVLSDEADAQMGLEDAFNAMSQAVEEAERGLLAAANGEPGIGLDPIRQMVSGAAEVYLPTDGGSRLADLVTDAEVAADLAERFSSALLVLESVSTESGVEGLQDAYAEVGEVLRGVQSSLAGQLGVTLMLSDADGDA